MAGTTGIQWTEATWNPLVGCTKVSPGCDNCYAETLVNRFAGSNSGFPNRFDVVTLRGDRHMLMPLNDRDFRDPLMIFVNSLSDLFHEKAPIEFIARVFAVIAVAGPARGHTFQLLTKRHGRMHSLLTRGDFQRMVWAEVAKIDPEWDQPEKGLVKPFELDGEGGQPIWPLQNLWLGVSVENQHWADIRVPVLLRTPAAVHWLSMEPLLARVALRREWMAPEANLCGYSGTTNEHHAALATILREAAKVLGPDRSFLDWIVVGGESGPEARPMHPEWVRELRRQCANAGVAFWMKQWGEHRPVPVVDAPTFDGGRAIVEPTGARVAATIRERTPGKPTMRGATSRPLQPGDRTKRFIMLDRDTVAYRMGKTAAGNELDGQVIEEYPAAGIAAALERAAAVAR